MELNAENFAFGLPAGHPVRTYFDENLHVKSLLRQLGDHPPEKDYQAFFNIFNQLCGVEKRYARKENQLFPYLEKRGWTGPSRGMWAFHDQIRTLLKEMRKMIESRDFRDAAGLLSVIQFEMARLIEVEENRLFPTALDILQPEDWEAMAQGESEIGWMHDTTTDQKPPAVLPVGIAGTVALEVGNLTFEQINLMLKLVPLDLTYVDENDRVLFYSRGESRVFPRSPGVIGREVQFCHPPKSLDTVLKILAEFRAGTKDEAEFWIDFRGRKIHIRYFAVRNAEKVYKGVIEVSQDITEIQKIQGENRLLNWT